MDGSFDSGLRPPLRMTEEICEHAAARSGGKRSLSFIQVANRAKKGSNDPQKGPVRIDTGGTPDPGERFFRE